MGRDVNIRSRAMNILSKRWDLTSPIYEITDRTIMGTDLRYEDFFIYTLSF